MSQSTTPASVKATEYQLSLSIGGTEYNVRVKPPGGVRSYASFHLDNDRGIPLCCVIDDTWGSACSCGGPTDCGHIAALRAAGHLRSQPRVEDVRCCPEVESIPCVSCLNLSPIGDKTEPSGMLADCPRCSGLGLRQILTADGIEHEPCTSCEGTGEVDHGTAEALAALIDAAHAEADEESWDDETRWVTADEEFERHEFCREYHERRWEERVEAGPTLPEQFAADRDRLHRLLSERADHHRHVDEGPDAEWAASQYDELLRLARATDATSVGELVDRLVALSEHYS